MNIYIIGICGTFMGGLARLARELGIEVSGSDANTYPPMSTQLESLGIKLNDGYSANNVDLNADIVVVGNTISRGNPELEFVLERGISYTSGAQWLADNVLKDRWVLAVAGTHGKTTTSSILAWILESNQLAPGYLIGGVPENFGESARLGKTPFFVIEADEYDTAFCDKRSKFVHYRPRTLVLNNLEFDHADIFDDLAAIQTQFHHLLKTIPQHGLIIHNQQSPALDEVIKQSLWSESSGFANASDVSQAIDSVWQARKSTNDASQFEIIHEGRHYPVAWGLIGEHNMSNALSAVAAAHHVGITVEHAAQSLTNFMSVKRRLEKIFDHNGIRIFDDFAHHPTAISETVKALRNNVGEQTIIAVLEPRSNTMKQGIHKHLLAESLQFANKSLIFADHNVLWSISELESEQISAFNSTQSLLEQLITEIKKQQTSELNAKTKQNANDGSARLQPIINILIMSNGGFENLHQRLIEAL